MITIERLTTATEAAVQDINVLLPQLREDPSEHSGSLADLQAVTSDKNIALIVAKKDEHIVGMATLYILRKLGKRTGHIEDVVVDSGQRGKGVGLQIMKNLIEVARTEKVKILHLTSRPDRVAGNKLYQKLGFGIKETNVYRMKL